MNLHELDATVWAQGNTNVTHGCLNLNRENAQWFYEFSQPATSSKSVTPRASRYNGGRTATGRSPGSSG